jgi:ribonucleotide monophosphatase NagD (HAD superfamily)
VFYDMVVGSLDPAGAIPRGAIAMVGDDVWSDVGGAQQAGLQGWLVRTGKFREDALASSGVTPDRLLDSVTGLLQNDPDYAGGQH